MLLFTFLIVDSNKDGLISTSDLLHIAGVKNNHSSRNKLVEKDVFKIVQAVRE